MKNLQPILLVEDDAVDVMTIKRALNDVGSENEVIHFVNGELALEYLKDEDHKEPCIIILDLNMPRMNGLEFIRILKAEPELKKIPVVVLTTSTNEKDISESFDSCVAGYMVKPADYEKFVDIMRTISCYWTVSELANRI
ncbi:MAG: response regulator [Planctomycetota bacterium]|jgi:CheY-like chemotaxis protein